MKFYKKKTKLLINLSMVYYKYLDRTRHREKRESLEKKLTKYKERGVQD